MHLDVVLDILTSTPQTWAAVLDADRHVVGTIALSDIVQNYQRTARTYLRQLSEKGGSTGLIDVVVTNDSPYVGVPLRSSGTPRGVLVTSIERGRDIVRPNGDTVLRAHDRVTAMGAPRGLDEFARASTLRSNEDTTDE